MRFSVVHPVPVGEIRPNTLTVNAKMDGLDMAYIMHDRELDKKKTT